MSMTIEDIISGIKSSADKPIEENDFEKFVTVATYYIEDACIYDVIGGNVETLLTQTLDRSTSIDYFMFIVHSDKFKADFEMRTHLDDKERAERVIPHYETTK